MKTKWSKKIGPNDFDLNKLSLYSPMSPCNKPENIRKPKVMKIQREHYLKLVNSNEMIQSLLNKTKVLFDFCLSVLYFCLIFLIH